MDNLELKNLTCNIEQNIDKDLIKLLEQNMSKKEILKILIKEKELLTKIGASTIITSIGYNYFKNTEISELLILGLIPVIKAVMDFKFYLDDVKNVKINDIILNSDNYVECEALYNEYLINLAQFLKSINIEKSLDTCIVYEILLRTGYLSYNKKNIFTDYKYDMDNYCKNLLGTRVLTGTPVCRHNASMLTDLLKKMDIQACNLIVKKYNNEIEQKISLEYDHMVTGIIDKDGRYIFDPTQRGRVATFDEKKAKNCRVSPEDFAFYLRTNFGYRINSDDDETKKFNQNNQKELKLFRKTGFKIISSKEVSEVSNYLNDYIFEIVSKEVEDFYREKQPVMKRIKTLNEQITPFSDSRIKSWKIK